MSPLLTLDRVQRERLTTAICRQCSAVRLRGASVLAVRSVIVKAELWRWIFSWVLNLYDLPYGTICSQVRLAGLMEMTKTISQVQNTIHQRQQTSLLLEKVSDASSSTLVTPVRARRFFLLVMPRVVAGVLV